MTTPLIVNGNLFNYPSTSSDPNWGSAATGWAIAITNGVLQKGTTGTTQVFTLLSDINFGASFGLRAPYFKSNLGSNIGTAGILRLLVSDTIDWRNNANTGDLALAVNALDQLTFNGSVIGITGNPVTGPSSSTNFAIPTFNGTMGNLLRNSGVTIDASSNITGLNNLTVGGTLSVTGLTTLGSLSLTALTATGLGSFGSATITGLTTSGSLTVTGLGTFGSITATGLTTTGSLSVTGLTTSGSLTVTGLGTFGSITATGAGTLGSLQITGVATLGSATATTVGTADNSTNVATTAYVKGNLVAANYQALPGNPTATTSTVGVMMGLAGAITPSKSGNILIVISGAAKNASGGLSNEVFPQIYFGTGTAPVNGAALTGSGIGNKPKLTGANNNYTVGFSCNAVQTGLTKGTTYWVDLGVASGSVTSSSVEEISISIIEQ